MKMDKIQQTYFNASVFRAIAETSGLEGGDGSQHKVSFEDVVGTNWELTAEDRDGNFVNVADLKKVTLKLRGDSEAGNLRRAFKSLGCFFESYEGE